MLIFNSNSKKIICNDEKRYIQIEDMNINKKVNNNK